MFINLLNMPTNKYKVGDVRAVKLIVTSYAYDLHQFIPYYTIYKDAIRTRSGKWKVDSMLFRDDGSMCYPTPRQSVVNTFGYRHPKIIFIEPET